VGRFRTDDSLSWMRAFHREQLEQLAKEHPELATVLTRHLEDLARPKENRVAQQC
jgi:hypothetical protein